MQTDELFLGEESIAPIGRLQYLRLYEGIECVVDLPDLAQCRFVPLPFDCSDTSICDRIPTDSTQEQMGFIDDVHIVILESADGSFLDQQQLVVWKSLPDASAAPQFCGIDWLYSFLVNRSQRAIIKWRDRCWWIDKTQKSVPIIVRLVRWERRNISRKLRLYFGTGYVKELRQYKLDALQFALDRSGHSIKNHLSDKFLFSSCGIRTRIINLTGSETFRLTP